MADIKWRRKLDVAVVNNASSTVSVLVEHDGTKGRHAQLQRQAGLRTPPGINAQSLSVA